MAFVPLAALAALAGTTTALYQSAQVGKSKNFIANPSQVLVPKPTATISGPSPVVSRTFMAKPKRASSNKPVVTKKRQSKQRAPQSTGVISRNIAPVLSGNGSKLVLDHCEPINIQQLLGAGALSYYTQALTPNFFPYLNGIAANFGKYRWLSMTVFYTPSCPTSTAGEAALGLFFDRQDAVAATYVQVTSMQSGVAFPPWISGEMASMTVDCTRFDKPRYNYIGTAALAALSTSDQNNYVPVSYASATQGGVLLAISGRIWVKYRIEMIDPIVAGINA